MIALVPLVFDCERENRFWTQGAGRSRVERLLVELSDNRRFDSVLVFSSEPWLWDQVPARKVEIQAPRERPEDLAWVKWVSERAAAYGCGHADIVLHLDVRNPQVNIESIDKAVSCFSRNAFRLVAAVTPDDDHPCQWKNHFNVMDAGIVHLFRRENSRWRPSSTARDFGLQSDEAFERLESLAAKVDSATCGVFHSDLFTADAARDPSTLRRVTRNADDDLKLRFPITAAHGELHAVVQAFCNGDTEKGQPTFQKQLDAVGSVSIALSGRFDFLTFALLEGVSDGPYQLKESIEPPNEMWSVTGDGTICKAGTTERIGGRQGFTPVAVQENALIVASLDSLAHTQRLLESGQAGSIFIESRTLFIGSEAEEAYAAAVLAHAKDATPLR